jgi:D-alanine-D-alanine ligase
MATSSLTVALLANLKENAPHDEEEPPDAWDDLDSRGTIDTIAAAIESAGHRVRCYEGSIDLVDKLRHERPDIAFNICEGHWGDSREAQIPAILEMLRIPYTGSKILTLALTLDKPMTKRVLTYHDLPTPEFQVFDRIDEPLHSSLTFPLFVKPSREGTGMGVGAESICRDEKQLRERVHHIIERYRQPALVERYIEGREVTVGMIGNLPPPVARRLPDEPIEQWRARRRQLQQERKREGLHFMPILEVDLGAYPPEEMGVYGNRLKVELADDYHYFCPAALTEAQTHELYYLAEATFRVTGCLDVARIDFRLDAHQSWKPYVLEINPLPGLSKISDLVIAAQCQGISQAQVITMILDSALKRYGLGSYAAEARPRRTRRPMRRGDFVDRMQSRARAPRARQAQSTPTA